MISKNLKIILVSLLLIFIFISGGLFIWRDMLNRKADKILSDALLRESSPPPPAQVSGGESPRALTLPDLDKPIVIQAALSTQAAAKARATITDLTAELKKNPDLYSSWLELGSYRKLIGDSRAALEIWQYVSKNWPSDSVAFNNLANLYIYELPDFNKAEEYLLKAIQKAPHQTSYYYNAYEFYRFVIKNTFKARKILEQAIAQNPIDESWLKTYLAELQ